MTNPLIHRDNMTGWVRGALIMQPELCAQLSHILHSTAQQLWELTTETDYETMWQGARDAAGHILAATDAEAVERPKAQPQVTLVMSGDIGEIIAKIAAAAAGKGEPNWPQPDPAAELARLYPSGIHSSEE